MASLVKGVKLDFSIAKNNTFSVVWELLTDVNEIVSKPRTQVNNNHNKSCDFMVNTMGSSIFN